MKRRDHDHTQDPEVTLMLAFQNGDEEAFVTLYRAYRDRIVNFSRRLLADAARGEEAAQDVFTLHATQQARRVAIASAVRGILTAPQREQVMLLSPCPMGQGGGMMMRQGSTDSPMRQ